MKSKYQKVKGTFDITPENMSGWTEAKTGFTILLRFLVIKKLLLHQLNIENYSNIALEKA